MWSILSALLLTGCREVEPAPADLDGLMHWYWQEYPEGEHLDEGLANLDAALAALPAEGTLSDLSRDETALAGLDHDPDPAEAQGLYVGTALDCDLATIEQIAIATDQGALFDTFDAYSRAYTSDAEAFRAGEVDSVTWEASYTVSIPLTGTYTADLEGGLRRVGEDALVSRSVLVEPAEWEGGGSQVFDQDWRIEVWFATESGAVHAEGLWRHMDAGVVSTDSTSVQRMILDGIADWDAQVQVLCDEGLP